MIHHGDCLEVMRTMPDASVDAIVTDPPYGLSFMGKAWDHGVPAGPFWAEMLRVAKPGAYLLAFGGTRTVHRIATNIEDSGWIIRDTLVWCYASGFPKGRANLKPAWEPIVMARKPGPLQHLNIEECRIPADGRPHIEKPKGDWVRPDGPEDFDHRPGLHQGVTDVGRWPSNVLLSDPELFDEPNPWVVGSGATSEGGAFPKGRVSYDVGESWGKGMAGKVNDERTDLDGGGYSRFFIIPKAGRAERERGLPTVSPSECALCHHQLDEHKGSQYPPGALNACLVCGCPAFLEYDRTRANTHPTVKPTDLMRHLVRLVTPPGGTVLDPFLGSGTTAMACELEGFPWIGIEKEAEYVAIAEARLNGVQRGLGLDVPAPTKAPPKTHPDLSKHQPKRRAPAENWTGGWTGTDEEPAA